MTTIKPYHTHGKDDYGTPKPLYDLLDKEFHLTLDVSADAENTKCDQFLTKEMDALKIDWWGRVFMNPPFSLLNKFLTKMIVELMSGRIELGVAIVAARSDTEAMFLASSYAGETRFLKGRVSYLVYPTEWQREACVSLQGITIEGTAWPLLVKQIELPKTALLALIKDPNLPGGHELLSIGAPFPSTVLIFDRRPVQTTVYWDWKKKVKTSYVFAATPKGKLPWEKKPLIPGSLLEWPVKKLSLMSKDQEVFKVPPIAPSLADMMVMKTLMDEQAAFLAGVPSPMVTEAVKAGAAKQSTLLPIFAGWEESGPYLIDTTHDPGHLVLTPGGNGAKVEAEGTPESDPGTETDSDSSSTAADEE